MVEYRACFEAAWDIQPIVVTEEKDPLNPSAPREQKSAGPGGAGTLALVALRLPIQACAVASLTTANVGRSFRGRFFAPPGLNEGDQNDGAWGVGGAYLVRVQNLLDDVPREPDIVSGLSTSTANWVVYSRTRRALDQDPYASKITGVQLHTEVHWLRSRAA